MARKGWFEKLLEEKDSQVKETMDEEERMKYEEEQERRKQKAREEEESRGGFLMKTLRSFTSRAKR